MYSIFLGIVFPQILSTYNKLNTPLHINTVQSNIQKNHQLTKPLKFKLPTFKLTVSQSILLSYVNSHLPKDTEYWEEIL